MITRLSSNLVFCSLYCELWDLSRSSGSRKPVSHLPNPRSISQTKAPLEKLSPRASRNQYSQSIPQATANHPVQAPHLSPTNPQPQSHFHYIAGRQCSFFPHSDTRASSCPAIKNKMLLQNASISILDYCLHRVPQTQRRISMSVRF